MEKNLAKSTVFYTVGNVLSKAILFFMLPIYTKYINPSDYGYYELTLSIINIISGFLYMEIWGAMLRYILSKKNKNAYAYNGFIYFILSSLVLLIATIIFYYFKKTKYIYLIYLYAVSTNAINVYSSIARGNNDNLSFAISGIINTLITVCSGIIMIIFLKFDYSSLYISVILGALSQIIFLDYKLKIFKNFKTEHYDRNIFNTLLKYSLPLCINSLSYWILLNFNKIYLSYKFNNEMVGYYSIAMKFSVILNTIMQGLSLALQEFTYSLDGKSDTKSKYFSDMSNKYLNLLFSVTLIVLPFISIIYSFIINKQYYSAKSLVPISIIASVFSLYSSYLGNIYGNIEKTNELFNTTMIGTIISVLSVYFLTNYFGVVGANLSYALGFLAMIIIRLVSLRKYIKININIKNQIKNIILVIIFSVAFLKNKIINIILFAISILYFFYINKNTIMYYINNIRGKFKNERNN